MSEYTIQPTPIFRTSKNLSSIGVNGEWTPSITFITPGDLSVGYQTRVGTYQRLGDLMFSYFAITTSTFTHTTASGDLLITELPYKATDRVNMGGFGSLFWRGITKANYTDIVVRATLDDNKLFLTMSGSGQVPAVVSAADMPTGGTVQLFGGALYQLRSET